MAEITTKAVADFFGREPAKAFGIEGIVDSGDALYLGQVALDKLEPRSRYGYWFQLSDTARFRTLEFSHDEVGEDGLAIIFRQFDSSQYQDAPEEHFAGWVPRDKTAEAERWLETMTNLLNELLERKRNAT